MFQWPHFSKEWGFLMSCSLRLRAQLNHEIVEVLSSVSELRPFISAWAVIEQRFNGIAELDDSLDPVLQIHCLLQQELATTNLVTEEVFLLWLLQLKVFRKNIVCRDTSAVWEPIMESFADFSKKSPAIGLSEARLNADKVKEFSTWVFKLCDWDSSVLNGHQQKSGLH